MLGFFVVVLHALHIEVIDSFFLNEEEDGKVICAISSLFSIVSEYGVLCKMLSSLAPALSRR